MLRVIKTFLGPSQCGDERVSPGRVRLWLEWSKDGAIAQKVLDVSIEEAADQDALSKILQTLDTNISEEFARQSVAIDLENFQVG